MHVLVIDDLKTDRYIFKKVLSSFFEVTTLSSAKEAVTFAIDNTFDIALINVMLCSDMDCIELLHDLQFSQSHFLPYAITAHIDSNREERLLEAGFKEVIRKPFEFERFIELLKKEEYKFSSYANYINVNKEPALF
ncbi:MAG TPA: response regulator [Cyclobacteriaceae bacterium]